jgi:hypothetical protein
MPRIYSPNEAHECDWANVPFVEGAAAVAVGADTTHFLADGYTIDPSKHALELWDGFTVAQLDIFYAWLGGTVVAEDTKYAKVRKIETSLSAAYIAALTIASAAATAGTGKTKVTITSPGEYDYYYKTATTTPAALLYGDVPDSTWTLMVLDAGVQDEIEPADVANDKITVVRVTAGGVVSAIGTDDLTVKS